MATISRQVTRMSAVVVDHTTPHSLSPTSTALGDAIDEKKLGGGGIPTENALAKANKYKKLLLLIFFCVSQFIEAVNLCSLFTSIVDIAPLLHLDDSDAVWLLSAYQLTFASFLLLSGRVADVYNPKHVFNVGFGSLGIFSLVAGFLRNGIALIVFRALMGIGAALTIPAALNLIVHLYPDPISQERAVAAFGGSLTLGIVCGLVIGALFTQLASWIWIFYFNAIICIPIAVACFFLIPNNPAGHQNKSAADKAKGLDLPGVSILTIALILFIFAITTGGNTGWDAAGVIAPLIISVVMAGCFFVYEYFIPEHQAAFPPRLWKYPNFAVLLGISLYPYLWWTAAFYLFATYWQTVFHWSPLLSAAHSLPLGFAAMLTIFVFIPILLAHFSLRTILLLGGFFTIPGSILCAFASRRGVFYWEYEFPAFILGSMGCAILFVNSNIAILKSTPPSEAGVIGAVFNSGLQLGAAIGTSAINTIRSSVSAMQPDPATTYKGYEAGWWFCLAVVGVEMIMVVIFFDTKVLEGPPADPHADPHTAVGAAEEAAGTIAKEGAGNVV